MSRARINFTAIGKNVGVHFAVLPSSAAVFGFFCILVFHSWLSVNGCSVALALAALLWLWARWRSEEPALRTFTVVAMSESFAALVNYWPEQSHLPDGDSTMHDLVHDEPEIAWSAILEILQRQLTEDQLALLASWSGPLDR